MVSDPCFPSQTVYGPPSSQTYTGRVTPPAYHVVPSGEALTVEPSESTPAPVSGRTRNGGAHTWTRGFPMSLFSHHGNVWKSPA